MVIRKKRKGRAVLCVPAEGGAYFAEAAGEVIGREAFFAGGDPAALVARAVREGFRGPRLFLALTLPGLRVEARRFPDMTEEELGETLRWEQDRLFRSAEPLAMDWKAIAHSPEGWETCATACEEEAFGRWADGARAAGWRVARAAPLLPSEGEQVVFVGRKECLMLARSGGLAKRRFRAGEEESALPLLTGEETPLAAVPMADCGREDWAACLAAGLPFPPYEEALRGAALRLLRPPLLDLSRPADRDRPFFCRENRTLRLAQGACAVLLLALVGCTAGYLYEERALAAEETRAAALTDAWRSLSAARKARAAAAAARREGRAFVAGDPAWDHRLLSLAESLPPGVAVRALSVSKGAVRLEGTSASSAAVTELAGRLAAAWGLSCRVETVRREAGLPFSQFVIAAEAKEGGRR